MRTRYILISVIAIALGALVFSACSNPVNSSNQSGSMALKSLTVSSGTLVPSFDPAVENYTVTGYSLPLVFNATTEDKYAGLGFSEMYRTLNATGTITITVTSPDFSKAHRYHVTAN